MIKMADYLITMDTGEKFLAHYGVQGMKWGKWNTETQARYASAGNSTYYKKAKRGDEYGRSVTDKRREYNANQPKSKQIAKNLLLGPGGAHAYNTARSRGLSRGDALMDSTLGPFYAAGVKHKQKLLETTTPKVSKAAKERGDQTRNESIVKSGAKNALGGYVGQNMYDTVKARTGSRGKAALAGAGASIGTGLAGGLLGPAGVGAAVGGAYALARRNGYDKQVKATEFRKRAPGEKDPAKVARQEAKAAKKATKEAAKNAVDSKVKETKEKSVLQQHQEARKEFQKSNKTNESIKGLNKKEQSVVNDARKSKEYKNGLEGGYKLMTNGFDVDRSSSTSRAQVTRMRDSMADLARKELERGNTKNALNSMAKAEAYDAWLNSKDDADFKRRLGI